MQDGSGASGASSPRSAELHALCLARAGHANAKTAHMKIASMAGPRRRLRSAANGADKARHRVIGTASHRCPLAATSNCRRLTMGRVTMARQMVTGIGVTGFPHVASGKLFPGGRERQVKAVAVCEKIAVRRVSYPASVIRHRPPHYQNPFIRNYSGFVLLQRLSLICLE
jgi:hypothetical protein